MIGEGEVVIREWGECWFGTMCSDSISLSYRAPAAPISYRWPIHDYVVAMSKFPSPQVAFEFGASNAVAFVEVRDLSAGRSVGGVRGLAGAGGDRGSPKGRLRCAAVCSRK